MRLWWGRSGRGRHPVNRFVAVKRFLWIAGCDMQTDMQTKVALQRATLVILCSIAIFSLSFIWLAGGPVGSLAAAESAAQASRPNIVIFIADDCSWHDIACFGGPTSATTPNLDALAREGMKLTGFFSPASVCSPTRQALLTGLYPVRSGAYPNHAVVRPGTKSLPSHLGALGYRTAVVGKQHFGPAASYPFDKEMSLREEPARQEASSTKPANPVPLPPGADGGTLPLGRMQEFVEADGKQPFCLYIATKEPHGPHTRGDRSAYQPDTVILPPYLVDTPETRQDQAAYLAEVSYMDQQVGAVLRMLADTGHTNDTLMLFFSEQGSSLPHSKWTCYDVGIRVAAIARFPGVIKPGSECGALVQYVDLLPTLLVAAGADPATIDTGCPDAAGSRGFDGRSFLNVLTGQSQSLRDVVFAQHTGRGINRGPEAFGTRAVRDNRYKLIVNLEPEAEFQGGAIGGPEFASWETKAAAGDAFAVAQVARYRRRPALEFYDLQTDPWEMENLAGEPDHAATITRLRGRLDAWMTQQGDRGDATEREAHLHQRRNNASQE